MASAIPAGRLNRLSLRVFEADQQYKLLADGGWNVLGSGAGRIVATHECLPEGTLAKFAVTGPSTSGDPFATGTVQNAVEAAVWRSALELRSFCAPIIAVDSRDTAGVYWLIQPNCPDGCSTAINNARAELSELGYSSDDLFHHRQWGSFNFQPVCYDYGYAHPSDIGACPLADLAAGLDIWNAAYHQHHPHPS